MIFIQKADAAVQEGVWAVRAGPLREAGWITIQRNPWTARGGLRTCFYGPGMAGNAGLGKVGLLAARFLAPLAGIRAHICVAACHDGLSTFPLLLPVANTLPSASPCTAALRLVTSRQGSVIMHSAFKIIMPVSARNGPCNRAPHKMQGNMRDTAK